MAEASSSLSAPPLLLKPSLLKPSTRSLMVEESALDHEEEADALAAAEISSSLIVHPPLWLKASRTPSFGKPFPGSLPSLDKPASAKIGTTTQHALNAANNEQSVGENNVHRPRDIGVQQQRHQEADEAGAVRHASVERSNSESEWIATANSSMATPAKIEIDWPALVSLVSCAGCRDKR